MACEFRFRLLYIPLCFVVFILTGCGKEHDVVRQNVVSLRGTILARTKDAPSDAIASLSLSASQLVPINLVAKGGMKDKIEKLTNTEVEVRGELGPRGLNVKSLKVLDAVDKAERDK